MSTATPTKSHWMTQPRCVGCGLRASTGDSKTAHPGACPRCGIDWLDRPPRSYAELEGFEVATGHSSREEARVLPTERSLPTHKRVFRIIEVGLFLSVVLVALAVASANIVAALRAGMG